MTALIQAPDFPSLFRNKIPLMDVRAPLEFNRGAFPTASNLPLLEDSEREAVGRCYKERGREAAVALGHELVSAETRQQRLQAWLDFVADNPGTIIYCYRGGIRSTLCQQWLAEAGIELPRVAGGYKAMRRFLIERIDELAGGDNIVVVAGKTGSGKTHFINGLANSLDLEGYAHHRGSAFGNYAQPQPSQIDFENTLAIRLLDLQWQRQRRIVVEDESRAIGSLSVPQSLHGRMNQSPIAVIEASLEQRIDTIHLDYIQSNFQDYQQLHPENAAQLFSRSLSDSLQRIKRRLGPESYTNIHALLQEAIAQQLSGNGIDAHRLWIKELLTRYYDPMYEYQLGKKSQRIVFRGNQEELTRWLQPMVGD